MFTSTTNANMSDCSTTDQYAFVVADLDGIIRFWSQGAETLFGYDSAGAIGRPVDLIIPDEFREKHWAGFRAAMRRGGLKGGVDQVPTRVPVLRSDGTTTRFSARVHLLRDAEGHATGVAVVFGASTIDGAISQEGQL
jgi:PAS domain S-box-containing protein